MGKVAKVAQPEAPAEGPCFAFIKTLKGCCGKGEHSEAYKKEVRSRYASFGANRAAARVGKIAVEGRYHRLPRRITDDYNIQDHSLGSGFNGVVYSAVRKEESWGFNCSSRYAVKSFKFEGKTSEEKESLASEVLIFLTVDHPHIARLADVYESEDCIYLVMECMEGGELLERIQAEKTFTESNAQEYTYQMLLALQYLHSHGIVHRDVKLENFMFQHKDSKNLKLIDFGFSKIWHKNTKMEQSCGTLAYIAPEVLSNSYTSKCDLWSLGVIVFVLLVGYMPFHADSDSKMTELITQGRYCMRTDNWANVSELGLEFVRKLLKVSPRERLSAQQALAHSWIADRNSLAQATKGRGLDQQTFHSLCNFAKESRFRRSCLQLAAWSLTSHDRIHMRDAFLELDRSHGGSISLKDFQQIMKEKFEMPEEQATLLFSSLDSNGSQEISYSEFLAAAMSSRIDMHDDLLKATFRRFDRTGSGKISPADMSQVLGIPIDKAEVAKELNVDEEGRICMSEFIEYVRHGTGKAAETIAPRLASKTRPLAA
eukprot:TRINITY_DN100980_c0_g1_i1.p1 TRINITY_DN100980_c0_g1~~TRINITY_DN100980_c0_g1_i1.p1  ORF type:complete len:542 (-),score=144.26 TRINITY_DN100980_c0_g1_i1:186-1811(-)